MTLISSIRRFRVLSAHQRRWYAPVALCLAACAGSTEIVTPPPPPPAAIVVQFVADSEDTPSAQALGWQTAIPEVDLTLRPEDTTKGAAQQFRGNSQGSLTLANLSPGRYSAFATRWLTPAERGRLPGGDDAVGFVARATVDLAAPGIRTLLMPASRRRSLVISEWAFNVHDYQFGGFLELHNNADTTVYLDGMIVAQGFNRDYDYPLSGCAENSPYTNDPNGIWTRFFQQFPGSGRDHPVPAGGTVVVATDAIDHRPLSEAGIDLRSADFEFGGHLDADNPAVPNLVEVGLRVDPFGHGLVFPGLSTVTVVARALSVAQLERAHFAEADYARIPRDAILDVLSLRSRFDAGFPPCPRLVNNRFDRAESYVRGTDEIEERFYSVSRRAIPPPGPGLVLQHSRSGVADLVRTVRNPGQIP